MRPHRSQSTGCGITHLIEDVADPIAGAQIAAREVHGWGSRIAALQSPDHLVFDLDPDASVGFSAVVQAAHEIRHRLVRRDIASWPMLSGGKGVHVVVPLAAGLRWHSVAALAKGFTRDLAVEAPERFLAEISQAERHGRIFTDWLRNERGATAVMPFSPRALVLRPRHRSRRPNSLRATVRRCSSWCMRSMTCSACRSGGAKTRKSLADAPPCGGAGAPMNAPRGSRRGDPLVVLRAARARARLACGH